MAQAESPLADTIYLPGPVHIERYHHGPSVLKGLADSKYCLGRHV
jgi:hypothetical protein